MQGQIKPGRKLAMLSWSGGLLSCAFGFGEIIVCIETTSLLEEVILVCPSDSQRKKELLKQMNTTK